MVLLIENIVTKVSKMAFVCMKLIKAQDVLFQPVYFL